MARAIVERNGIMQHLNGIRKAIACAASAPAVMAMAVAAAAVLAAGVGSVRSEDAPGALDFSGVGWVQYGQVQKSSDTIPNNYNGNPM